MYNSELKPEHTGKREKAVTDMDMQSHRSGVSVGDIAARVSGFGHGTVRVDPVPTAWSWEWLTVFCGDQVPICLLSLRQEAQGQKPVCISLS